MIIRYPDRLAGIRKHSEGKANKTGRAAKHSAARPVILLSAVRRGIRAVTKQQRDAPQRGYADQSVNDPAHHTRLPTEQEGDQIKTEQADAAPVQAADDGERQSDLIQHKRKSPFQFTVV